MRFPPEQWALVLGASSGFGLATAKKLARHGLNIVAVHRDRRGAMKRINPEFDEIRASGVQLLSLNTDALDSDSMREIVSRARQELGEEGRFRVLLHSIALGNLKPLIEAPPESNRDRTIERIADKMGVEAERLRNAFNELFTAGHDELFPLVSAADYGRAAMGEEDVSATVYNMGTSLLSWTKLLLDEELFARDARVLALTSEGNEVAWRGYAAVAAAKVAMEALSRAMALEFAPYGLRSNVVQAGISETPASSLIPGISAMKAQARLRNPFGRLTRPDDVADFIFLMCTDEAAWVNGSLLRVDGGEHISGSLG